MKPYFSLFLLLIVLTACSNDDSQNEALRQYTGYYSMVSFQSDRSVDLNNDGLRTTQLLDEIKMSNSYDLEIRPLESHSNDSKLISFFFPKTNLTFQYPGEPEGYTEFTNYGFGTQYEFINNTFQLQLRSYVEQNYIDNIQNDLEVTIESDLIILSENRLRLDISKEFYDYHANEWVRLAIEIIYQKK